VRFAIAPCAVLALIFNEAHWGKHGVMHNIFEVRVDCPPCSDTIAEGS
jgi:hypothetical protein